MIVVFSRSVVISGVGAQNSEEASASASSSAFIAGMILLNDYTINKANFI